MQKIEVYFTPNEYVARQSKHKHLVVVVDILRASTTICTALANGVKAIIPVEKLADAKIYKNKGYLVASERNSDQIDFADLGNSPFSFLSKKLEGQEIVLSTTNGTKSIAASKGAQEIVIGAFLNLTYLAKYLISKKGNITILCSGWKGVFNLEDTAFAGALSDLLLQSNIYRLDNDSAVAANSIWQSLKSNLAEEMLNTEASKRLLSKGLKKEIDYCFKMNQVHVIPILENNRIIKLTPQI